MSDADRINSIKASDDIIRILKSGETSNAEVSSSSPSIELKIVHAVGTQLVLGLKHKIDSQVPELSRAGIFSVGASIEIVFALIDGQYAIRDKIRDLTPTTFTVDASAGLLRLQRRKDFRVAVARGAMRFQLSGSGRSASSISLELIDLSAGGLRLRWPQVAGPIPSVGEKLCGDLFLKSGEADPAISVTLIFIKDQGVDAPLKPELGHALSFKFESLSQDDARMVLFACVGVYRSRYGS